MSFTVTGRTTLEVPPIKNSRFIATVAPVSTMAEALAVVDEVAAAGPRANHHCWAVRLSDGTSRSSDDGEPSGSAGRPILARLEGREVEDCVVVVSRWFGGTKLGVGGLVRAYGGCAGAALDAADKVAVVRTVMLTVDHGYGDTGLLDGVFAEVGASVAGADYGAAVRRTLIVLPEQVATLRRRVVEATAGRAAVSESASAGE